jgi:oligopeptide/dipeptide ABC transporter ATP-binding protein
VRVAGLDVAFRTRAGLLSAVKNVSFSLRRGESLCVVGESGSGKSTLSMAIAGLLPSNAQVAGEVMFDGVNLLNLSEDDLSDIRGRRLGVVFQDAGRSLNPVLTIGRQIGEVLQRHMGADGRAARRRAVELLVEVGVNDPELRVKQYPHELSGGLKQRVMIATAIACEPDLLIADEPTTALDVTIQGQVLRLLQRLRVERGLSLILVTHDFGVVASMADRVAVMYAGAIVEYADAVELFHDPRHPYSEALLNANPRRVLDAAGEGAKLEPIPGSPPNPLDLFPGCSFAPRCPKKHDACSEIPALVASRPGHDAACWLPNA